MPAFNGNTPFVKLGSYVVTTPFSEVEISVKNDVQDVTAGTGVTEVQRAAGLNDTSVKLKLAYIAGSVSSYIQTLQSGAPLVFEYGPEGNTTGKPRHVQNMVVESVTLPQNSKKAGLFFDVSLVGNDNPTANMLAGAVYP